jgi:hypothetical protein
MAHLDVAAKLSSNPGSQRLGVRGSAARPDFSEPRHDVPTPHGPQQRASLPSNCSVTNRGTLTARASPQAPSLIQLHHSSPRDLDHPAPTTTWTRPSIHAVAAGPVHPLPTTERGDNKSADPTAGRRIVRAAPEHVVAPPPSAVAAQTFMNRQKLLPLLDGRASPPPPPPPPPPQ